MKEKTGFQPEFLETLIDESLLLLSEKTEGPVKELVDSTSTLIYLMRENPESLEIGEQVANITRDIWALGGSFRNAIGSITKPE